MIPAAVVASVEDAVAARGTGRPEGRLTLADRDWIESLTRGRFSPARIAALLGRPRSTITRELARGTEHGHYRARAGQAHAEEQKKRPKPGKLDDPRLRCEVARRLALRHSPQQIAARLRVDFPDDAQMTVSHETIYRALYVQARGSLAAEVRAALRTGRTRRRPHGRVPQAGRPGRFKDMINISERPAEADDRAVPGHWEGDLILGAGGTSAIGTLVERTTGFVMLLHLPGNHTAATVATAMTAAVPQIPELLRRSLTWDQGAEMARHAEITQATGLPIYFCDPHSPWQRATNENTNGLLRQYFPKGTDLSFHGPGILANVAAELNGRPRARLAWATPAEALQKLLSEPNTVALIP